MRVADITLRQLLVALVLALALLVLLLVLGGVEPALRDAGLGLADDDRQHLETALRSRLLARGIIALFACFVIALVVGGAASRLFPSRWPIESARARGRPGWLREARHATEAVRRAREEHAARVALLTHQRAEMDRMLEAVSEGILQIDSAGRIVLANRAARRLLALPVEVTGRPLGAVVRSAELRRLLQEATAEEGVPPREITVADRTLIVTARALPPGPPLADGAPLSPTGLAVAIADLTALRRLESMRRDFVANASHELKTPLTSIRGYAETLLDDGLPAETRRQFLATISSNANRLQRIVDDLLDLSRLESGIWKPSPVALSPAAAVREAWGDCADRALDRDIAFDLRVEDDREVSVDPSALRQVLNNLFDNALRYTAAGGRVEVRVLDRPLQSPEPWARDRRTDYLAIEVRDSGTGIPGDALPRIFERFYRVDMGRTRNEGGTGLGLAIVKHLTESMGGMVEAESQLGRGTTIRLVLPVAGGRGVDEAAPS